MQMKPLEVKLCVCYGCFFIEHQLVQRSPPRCYTGILNSNLPNGKSLFMTFEKLKSSLDVIW